MFRMSRHWNPFNELKKHGLQGADTILLYLSMFRFSNNLFTLLYTFREFFYGPSIFYDLFTLYDIHDSPSHKYDTSNFLP